MALLGVEWESKHLPVLDPDFLPLEAFTRSFLKTARQPIAITIERNSGLTSVYETYIHGTPAMRQADLYYAERIVKFLLWARGGFRVTICGDEGTYAHIRDLYRENGARSFDARTMTEVYGHPFEVLCLPYDQTPAPKESSAPLGGHTDGCRIGFDAGGSFRKVSAVMDGKAVFSEEAAWRPKQNGDPDYHFREIVASLKTAASKLPRVDAVGVSSAGIFVENETRLSSLFLEVPKPLFAAKVRNIYERACLELGDVPFAVANDGDVAALAGAFSLQAGRVLGIAMGTSEAGGYVNASGGITGWLNELAFAPVDASPSAKRDEWSGDIGCGVKYFSQEGVLKLAPRAGIALSERLTAAEKIQEIRELAEHGVPGSLDIYESIGCYLGHALPFYARFYDIGSVLLLGGITSGAGGERLIARCKDVLRQEYPDLGLRVVLPDQNSRSVAISIAAAGLAATGR